MKLKNLEESSLRDSNHTIYRNKIGLTLVLLVLAVAAIILTIHPAFLNPMGSLTKHYSFYAAPLVGGSAFAGMVYLYLDMIKERKEQRYSQRFSVLGLD